MKPYYSAFLALALTLAVNTSFAQTYSGASNAVATEVPHATVPFRIEDPGTKLPDFVWGFDLAWLSEDNVRRGTLYTGSDMIEIMRLSFQTTNTEALNGSLTQDQKKVLDNRIKITKKYAPQAGVNLNSDQMEGTLEQVTNWYRSSNSATQAERWSELIALTKAYVEANGLKVVSVSPFNEPDLDTWHQGSKADMLAICKKLREDETYKNDFADVLLCGGNTLNNDRAWEWYNSSRRYLDEGNTHQLAGSFDTFADFFQKVVADGKVGVGDELHNILECMVGSEYGMTKGIWWGTAEHTRSQFMKATRGTRMGYAEHRNNWTAASVYRHTDGSVQGFGGTSERQAKTTTYRFAAFDHDVFYNGQGPAREYIMTLPGGTGYQQGQTNAEGLFNIQGGEDIMPPLPTEATTYKIVNRLSGHVLAPTSNNASAGQELAQVKNLNNTAQQWRITPLATDCGGDFSYFIIDNVKDTDLRLDVKDWSLSDGGTIILWNGNTGNNEQWFVEYAEDGWFYIRSRHSAMYLQTQPGTETQMKVAGRKVKQGKFTGEWNQQWRLLPEGVTYDDQAPSAPSALTATAQPASVRLEWTAPSDRDIKGYTIQRSDDGGSSWHVINRYVEATAYVDNTANEAIDYQYRVLAQDKSLNHSEPSEVVTASPSMEPACIMYIACDSLQDATVNGNHVAHFGNFVQAEGHEGQAVNLTGTAGKFLQLPATIANSRQMTFAAWVNIRSTGSWQRIFDFGNDTDHYVFLCPNPGSGENRLRLAIKNGGNEYRIDATKTHNTNRWIHVAVTFSDEAITIYLNGEAVGTSTSISERPADFRPIFNYVGRSQFTADSMFKGFVDDIRMYNYALTAEEVMDLFNYTDGILQPTPDGLNGAAGTMYDLGGRQTNNQRLTHGVYIINGRKVMVK